ncbi:hypothetical protein [Aquidulcibacter paucihalophilus]|uniref:hypothetical protein n=1 Tax=Aquidulcibacter paucihalophilus TaxID=1978549 RepID=UPI000A18CE24|nr:hypothetical protein [Aquidulcibacter paucihalophilus]
MFSFLLLAAIAETPTPFKPSPLCDGIAKIEAATLDRPRAFRSLVATEMRQVRVRNGEGIWTMQERPVTVVKPLEGLQDCRFVYNSSISLACYGASVVDESDAAVVEQALTNFADEVAKCLKNEKLTRRNDDFGSAPSISFAGGAKEPFYQISIVPLPDVSDKRRPELLVLGAAELPPAPAAKPAPAAPKKAAPKAKKR